MEGRIPKIGAHVSIANGYGEALKKVHGMGGNCIQIFSSSPRTWRSASISSEQIISFKVQKKELGIDPVVFHAMYLLNLADQGEIGRKSVNALTDELNLAHKIGCLGSIIHIGSYKSSTKHDHTRISQTQYKGLLNNFSKVLEGAPKSVALILENSGTNKIGLTMEELGTIIRDLKDIRLKVCIDTCHLHAAGYDLSTRETVDEFLDKCDQEFGIERFAIIHVNDSKDERGSNRDRHENLGEGKIPTEMFEYLLNHKALAVVPKIIETPGFDKKGPDKKNLDILKKLLNVN